MEHHLSTVHLWWTVAVDRRRVQEQWSRQADAYTTSPLHRGTPDLDLMVEMIQPRSHQLALDLATGGGHTARTFAPHVGWVVAFDLTGRMLENSRRLAREGGISNMHFVQGDVNSIPFRDGAFDLVTVRAATHHFPHLRRALQEVHRVLRPGGRFLVNDSVVPNEPEIDAFVNEAEAFRDPTHVRSYSMQEWERHLQAAGFGVLRRESWRNQHDFQFWMELAGMDQHRKEQLEARFLGAPENIRASLDMVIKEGRVACFTDQKGLLFARK